MGTNRALGPTPLPPGIGFGAVAGTAVAIAEIG